MLYTAIFKQTTVNSAFPTISRGAGATIVLSPLTSILYLWDEPGGDRTLLWQPTNYQLHPEELPLNKVYNVEL
jgi:hypothetical protein